MAAEAIKSKNLAGESSSSEENRRWVFVLRCFNDSTPDNEWFKVDISNFINETIKQHRGGRRYSFGSGGGQRHSHERGVCNPVLFPVCNKSSAKLKAEKKEKGKGKGKGKGDDKDGERVPHPHARSSCAAYGSKIYMVGGSIKMAAFDRIAADYYGYPLPKCVGKEPPLTREEACNNSHVFREFEIDLNNNNKESSSSSSCEKVDPEWVVSTPLSSPRFGPDTVTIGDKIFLVGGNAPPDCPEDEADPSFAYAEAFCPKLGVCYALPKIPFPRISTALLHILPLLGSQGEQKLMLLARGPAHLGLTAVYDINRSKWSHWYVPPHQLRRGSLTFQVEDMYVAEAVAVAHQNTTYWTSGRFSDQPCFCAYNWKTRQLYRGPYPANIEPPSMPDFLHHLTADLFCYIWREFDELRTTSVHFTLLRISKNHSASTLDSFILGCICHVVNDYQTIQDIHLMSN